jgi:DNA-binding transcriptional regulator YbjK
MVSQALPSEPKLNPSEAETLVKNLASPSGAESLIKDLASQFQAWEQSHRSNAAIYREMAVSAESDSDSTRELKRQYARLAENEETAALAVEKLAANHAKLAALIHQSSDLTKQKNVFGDSAYRK